MKTLLFAPETFNLAETTRMIEVAKECQENAHCIFMGYSTKFVPFIEAEGFSFRLLAPQLTEEQIKMIMKFDQMKTIKLPFSYGMLKERIENEIQLIEELKPDGIIIGSTMSLLISARVKETPLIYVKPYAYTQAHVRSPLFLKHSTKYCRKAVQSIFLNLRWLPKSIKKLVKEYDVKHRFKYTLAALDADLNCITTPVNLTRNPDLPKNSIYVGPIFANLKKEIPLGLKTLLGSSEKTLIFCSMGSSANRQLIVDLLQSFAGISVEVISPMKSYLTETQIALLPVNVHLYDWLPAREVQQAVTASVIHGGEGTVQTACVSEKPFLGIGLQKEQEYNISCCVEYGNALSMKQKQLKNNVLFKEKVNELLKNQRYTVQARKLQQELGEIKGSRLAAEEIGKFLNKESQCDKYSILYILKKMSHCTRRYYDEGREKLGNKNLQMFVLKNISK